MSLAIPGSDGCFSFLQEALKPHAKRVRISPAVRDQLKDFLWLAESVVALPTHLAEIVPTPETYHGTVDASGMGMGGVWFPPLAPTPLAIRPAKRHLLQRPCLWREQFPPEIRRELISFTNPNGRITNSDLELAGTIAHDDILARLSQCLTSAPAPLLIIRPPSRGAPKGTLPPRVRPPTYFNSRHYTVITSVTAITPIFFLAILTSWQINAVVSGIYQILNCSPILILIIHRKLRGNCSTYSQRCALCGSPPCFNDGQGRSRTFQEQKV